MSSFATRIDPASLRDEILAVMRAGRGQMLKPSIKARCKLWRDGLHFNVEFSDLVDSGQIKAVNQEGIILYRLPLGIAVQAANSLSEVTARPSAMSRYRARRAGLAAPEPAPPLKVITDTPRRTAKSEENSRAILALMASGEWYSRGQIMRGAGISSGSANWLLSVLMEQGCLLVRGSRRLTEYKLAEQQS